MSTLQCDHAIKPQGATLSGSCTRVPVAVCCSRLFYTEGNNFLAVADRFTGWLELVQMDGKVLSLIKVLRNLFAQKGVPVELATDGGPTFTVYDFDRFCKQWGIRHRLSSAH